MYMTDAPAPSWPPLSEAEQARLWGLKAGSVSLRVLTFMREGGDAARHLTAEQIYQAMQTAASGAPSLASVYRALSQLESMGLVQRHWFDPSRAVYELGTEHPHDHLVCLRCGRVDEFQNPALDELPLQIGAQHGYSVRAHRLVIYGVCGNC